jgi:GRAM domain
VADPPLNPGEQLVGRFRANRSQGGRAVGGHLLLTDQRLVFAPHKIDAATGGAGWQCSLRSISSVSVAPRGKNLFDGSLRRRLMVTSDGAVTYFVVPKVADVASAIMTALA